MVLVMGSMRQTMFVWEPELDLNQFLSSNTSQAVMNTIIVCLFKKRGGHVGASTEASLNMNS